MNSSILHDPRTTAPLAHKGNGKLLHEGSGSPAAIDTAAPAPAPLGGEPLPGAWGFARRILFRFTFVYLILYMVPSLLGSVRLFALFLEGPWPWINDNVYQPYANVLNGVVGWLGTHVFHVEVTVPVLNGDYTADWLLLLFNVVVAAAATAVWSLLDRRRHAPLTPLSAGERRTVEAAVPSGEGWLYSWLRVAVCFYLAAQMILYGMVKVIPNQFGTLSPEVLTTMVCDLDRMTLLWTFMAASPAYTIFSGAAEVLGGLLLTCRRTRLLGALVVLGVMANVVMLNMCYDVSVKLHSSHLLAMTVFVAAADLRRLVDFFVLGRAPSPAIDRTLFATPWLQRGGQVLMTALVFGFVAVNLHMNITRSLIHGHLAPKPALHGIWNVEEIVVDDVVQPPLRSDRDYWLRASFDSGVPRLMPPTLRITRMDKSRLVYLAQVDTDRQIIVLSKHDDADWQAMLAYSEPVPGTLVMEGMLDGRQVRITFHRVDEAQLPLHQSIRWIREPR